MKTFISLSALFLSLTLTAQTSPATWYLNDASGNGIQSPTNTASGSFSVAMGSQTQASGLWSIAAGAYSNASGTVSLSIGYESIASGDNSTAIGYRVTAKDRSSLVMGQYNLAGSTVTESATEFSLDNTAFVIGNGISPNAKSDALVVKFNGDATLAGSMTATSFIGDGSQLTNLPSSGADSPFSYNSNEAGGIEVADYTTASGTNSTAMGAGTIASGIFSTAMGANTEASGNRSTAMGHFTTASGAYSTAMGYETTASESGSTAMGHNTTASGIVSTAIGLLTKANGSRSTAMGEGTTASDKSSLVMGQYNLAGSTVTTSATEFSLDNTALVIGNGADFDNRSDALVVKFNGDATLAGNLNINSDARLKANIISLGATLS